MLQAFSAFSACKFRLPILAYPVSILNKPNQPAIQTPELANPHPAVVLQLARLERCDTRSRSDSRFGAPGYDCVWDLVDGCGGECREVGGPDAVCAAGAGGGFGV